METIRSAAIMETIRSAAIRAIKLSAQPPTSGSDSKLGDDFIAIIPDNSHFSDSSDEDDEIAYETAAIEAGTVNSMDILRCKTENVSAKREFVDDFVHVENPSAA